MDSPTRPRPREIGFIERTNDFDFLRSLGQLRGFWITGDSQHCDFSHRAQTKPPILRSRVSNKALSSDLLLHGLSHTTIGAGAFHCRVRDGNGWDHTAITAEQAVNTSRRCADVA